MTNPFEFKNPDEIKPNDLVDLFVPVFGEYYNVPRSGHTFINGPRGSGKSMMFRFMRPDCQVLVDSNGKRLTKARKIKDLDYFSIYIPIKKGHLNKTDIQLNNKHGEALLNEHFMVVHFAQVIFKELLEVGIDDTQKNRLQINKFFNGIFCDALRYGGYTEPIEEVKNLAIGKTINRIIEILKRIHSQFQHEYLKKLINSNDPLPYNGPILLYTDFLYELLTAFKSWDFMPSKAIFLLIDDADELNLTQRKILNSWVSLRTSNEVSLKISTQLKYKIYSTINESRIDTPHDYTDVNLNDIYTTKKDVYFNRVYEIVAKRLEKYKFKITDPEKFFPSDTKQAAEIEKIRIQYQKEQIKKGQNKHQAYDYAYRYAVPDFIKNLEGNRYTFSYAGFDQLVNISSGIIREFISFAFEMFVAQQSQKSGAIKFIDPEIQDKEIKKYSEWKIESEFDKYRDESDNKRDMDKLRNLLMGMGGLFRTILISESSERRVFSVALNDEPDEELKNILDLGVQHGYLQKSMIGNKYGTGKSRLYILNRILAPHFGLDPSSFAGYKFMKSSALKKSLEDPKRFIDMLKKSVKGVQEDDQLQIFEQQDGN